MSSGGPSLNEPLKGFLKVTSIFITSYCPTVNFPQLLSIVALARYFPKDTADDVQLDKVAADEVQLDVNVH
ncbi:uncharacterized protein BJ212DRAFT_1475187 [Suillus subaureus]|uniref:Uncharacterized protein n=1 Tax=Suillus subaureus TaxID=48587 RepID=A0A9P7EN04_9AGAM|nr:uncharacterized protein BJ212DRAFT_1475187 [Suillus subaureus]KAG1825810.1 hypothetical protein BJ212DRAFT_1475187 [Suillus subaureus]